MNCSSNSKERILQQPQTQLDGLGVNISSNGLLGFCMLSLIS
ncbi:hypothetical protein pb186bvf_020912 [Paramecium bursaria]